MHIGVWKSLMFLQASRQKNKKNEGSGWRFLQKLPSFTKIRAKTSLFYKNSCKNFPLLQNSCKNFPLLQKFMQKLPSFTKIHAKNFPLLQKFMPKTSLFYKNSCQKLQKKHFFGGFKTAIRLWV
jgi:hypothetical protein